MTPKEKVRAIHRAFKKQWKNIRVHHSRGTKMRAANPLLEPIAFMNRILFNEGCWEIELVYGNEKYVGNASYSNLSDVMLRDIIRICQQKAKLAKQVFKEPGSSTGFSQTLIVMKGTQQLRFKQLQTSLLNGDATEVYNLIVTGNYERHYESQNYLRELEKKHHLTLLRVKREKKKSTKKIKTHRKKRKYSPPDEENKPFDELEPFEFLPQPTPVDKRNQLAEPLMVPGSPYPDSRTTAPVASSLYPVSTEFRGGFPVSSTASVGSVFPSPASVNCSSRIIFSTPTGSMNMGNTLHPTFPVLPTPPMGSVFPLPSESAVVNRSSRVTFSTPTGSMNMGNTSQLTFSTPTGPMNCGNPLFTIDDSATLSSLFDPNVYPQNNPTDRRTPNHTPLTFENLGSPPRIPTSFGEFFMYFFFLISNCTWWSFYLLIFYM
jgi:hypothetical protein